MCSTASHIPSWSTKQLYWIFWSRVGKRWEGFALIKLEGFETLLVVWIVLFAEFVDIDHISRERNVEVRKNQSQDMHPL